MPAKWPALGLLVQCPVRPPSSQPRESIKTGAHKNQAQRQLEGVVVVLVWKREDGCICLGN